MLGGPRALYQGFAERGTHSLHAIFDRSLRGGLEFESLASSLHSQKRRSDCANIPIRARPQSATNAAKWPEFVQRQFHKGGISLLTRIPSQGTSGLNALLRLVNFSQGIWEGSLRK